MREVKKLFHIDVAISLLHRMNCRNVYSKGQEYVIVSERNNPKLAYPEHFDVSKAIYERADHVVFQTQEVQAMFTEKTRSHSSILPNPVSVSCCADDRRTKRIINVARLHENKNQELLIRAFARFLPHHPDYTLSLYGEGPAENALRALTDRLGIQDHVFFHGNVEDIHEQIADAGIFVLSSNTEGMPNALLEAMMMGLPCISTSCTGAKEVIRSGQNGILTKLRDVDSMADADVAISSLPHANLMNVYSRRREKVIVREGSDPMVVGKRHFADERKAMRLADHVVFQSRRVQGYFDQSIQSKSSIIYNPVAVSEKAASLRKSRIVAVGKLSPQKNHHLLIDAFSDFQKIYKDYCLDIYGIGALEEELQEHIRRAGLEDKVTLRGFSANLHAEIRDARMFVLSSNHEGLCNALLEAMTMGLACISTDVAGSTEIIENGENGLLVKAGDRKGLVKAMCLLAGNESLCRSLEKKAMETSEQFQIGHIIPQWEELL